jgi:hypothetical protein
MFDPSFPHGWWYYLRACDVAQLTDEVIDITVDHALRIKSPLIPFRSIDVTTTPPPPPTRGIL